MFGSFPGPFGPTSHVQRHTACEKNFEDHPKGRLENVQMGQLLHTLTPLPKHTGPNGTPWLFEMTVCSTIDGNLMTMVR